MSDLLAGLDRQAAVRPEEPFLFYPAGADWRWWSWGETARALRTHAAPAAELGDAGIELVNWLATAEPVDPRNLTRELAPGLVRDIVVVHGPPGNLVAALLLRWAVGSGAAVLAVPDLAAWPLALVWARPTIVAGAADDLDRLVDRVRRLERDPQRLRRRFGPLGRVRALVRVGSVESEGARWLGSLLNLSLVTLES